MALVNERISVDQNAPDSLRDGALKINENFDLIDLDLQRKQVEIDQLQRRLTHTERNMIDALIELETIKQAELNGVTANIFIETFRDLSAITVTGGVFNATQGKIELK